MLRALIALSLLSAPAAVMARPADPYAPQSFEGIKHPAWSQKAVIYQINTRQCPATMGKISQGKSAIRAILIKPATWGARVNFAASGDGVKVPEHMTPLA